MKQVTIHFIQQEQIEKLKQIFAKPKEDNGNIVWVIPQWLMELERTQQHVK